MQEEIKNLNTDTELYKKSKTKIVLFWFISLSVASFFFSPERLVYENIFVLIYIKILLLAIIVIISVFYFKNLKKIALYSISLSIILLSIQMSLFYFSLRKVTFTSDVTVFINKINDEGTFDYVVTPTNPDYVDYSKQNEKVKSYKKGEYLNFKYSDFSTYKFDNNPNNNQTLTFRISKNPAYISYRTIYNEASGNFSGVDPNTKISFGYNVDNSLNFFDRLSFFSKFLQYFLYAIAGVIVLFLYATGIVKLF
jgi:hypothetical protein